MKRFFDVRLIVIGLIPLLFSCSDHTDIIVPADLGIGEPFKAVINTGSASVKIPITSQNEEYSLVIYTRERGSYKHITEIDGGIASAPENNRALPQPVKTSISPADDFLRKAEREAISSLAERPLARISPKILSYTPPAKKSFKVLDRLDDGGSYVWVSADLVSYSANSAFYVDSTTDTAIRNDPAFIPAINRLRDDFDTIIAPKDRHYFGQESQVDDLAPIIILMSPVLNRMGYTYSGNILGFFYAHDLFPDGRYRDSNSTEIFYIAAFDEKLISSAGITTSQMIDECTDKIFHGTLAHEFQHMINFNQHVISGRGDAEEPWLNEGLSHLAEDLTGYGWTNISLVSLFLAFPKNFPLTGMQTSPGERGASYLFARYLFERFARQSPAPVTKLLASSRYAGTRNIKSALGVEFTEVYTDWLATLALSNSNISTQSDYSYEEPAAPVGGNTGPFQIGIALTGTNGNYELRGPWFDDLSSVDLSLHPSSAAFYKVKSNGRPQIDIELLFDSNAGSGVIVIPTAK